MTEPSKRSWVTEIRGVEPGEASMNFRRPYSVELADRERAILAAQKLREYATEIEAVSPECPACGWRMMANEDGTWSCVRGRCVYAFEPRTRSQIDNLIEDAGVRRDARRLS